MGQALQTFSIPALTPLVGQVTCSRIISPLEGSVVMSGHHNVPKFWASRRLVSREYIANSEEW